MLGKKKKEEEEEKEEGNEEEEKKNFLKNYKWVQLKAWFLFYQW